MERFLACFKAERARVAESPLRVRHLFLSLLGQANIFNPSRMDAILNAQNDTERYRRIIELMTQFGDDQDELSERYAPLVPALLELVSPDLRTFVLLQSKFRKLPKSLFCFPQLKELTLLGGDPKFARFTDVPADHDPLYPSLKRLHHIFVLMLLDHDDVDFVPWARHAPNVTHLKVSRLSARPDVTLDTLLRAYSRVAEEDVLFPHLKQVLIQPEAEPEEDDIAATVTIAAYRQYIQWLRQSVKETRVDTVLLSDWDDNVVGNLQQFHDFNTETALRDWLARIEGGEGCWALGTPAAEDHESGVATGLQEPLELSDDEPPTSEPFSNP
ncbi:hypothetical protein DICSQDRAFT_165967 [Dichomitus squalens LYAD-421 SS1]|uniref:uncharacterized protein n=1 Tax=Dichomitus squalens (strain LYAD-421) TaxID=732165 RepID=UPI0004415B8E|nr:uncharacterized protein DICSQDRAFT_165967 [Dichomitus squalens LYAD-421 SS1]EJF66265.1 hypothetical protein DICSQDRAFT_165967 [Dichomitus squalens LYAD-421 SS1]